MDELYALNGAVSSALIHTYSEIGLTLPIV